VLASALSALAFGFLFPPAPPPALARDTGYVVSLLIMLGVALLISGLTARVRDQAEDLSHRERRSSALYALGRELSLTLDVDEVLDVGVRHVREQCDGDVVVLLRDGGAGPLRERRRAPAEGRLDPGDRAVLDWVAEHGRRAGAGAEVA